MVPDQSVAAAAVQIDKKSLGSAKIGPFLILGLSIRLYLFL